jgi:hypothetical protein
MSQAAKSLSPIALDWSGMFHWVAAGASVAAVALLARIESWVRWPLASFVSTLLYLCLATLQLAFAARPT